MRPLHGRQPTQEQLHRLHGSLRKRLRQVAQRVQACSTALEAMQRKHDVVLHAAVQGCVDYTQQTTSACCDTRYPGALATLQQTVEASKQLAAVQTSLAASVAEHAMVVVRGAVKR